MGRQTQKSNQKKEDSPSDVFYMGKLWKVVGRKGGAQGEPWLHLKSGAFSAMAKEYEVEQTFN